MSKRVLLPIIILAIAVMIFAALFLARPERPPVERPDKIWRVETMTASPQRISPEVTLYGRVDTPRRASLNAAINADVVTVPVLEGAVVDKDTVLITLDNSDADLQLAQRQADLAEIEALIRSEKARYRRDKGLLANEKSLLVLAEKAVERAKKLDQTRLVTRSSVDDAIANQQRQLVTLKRLEHDIAEHPARLAGLEARFVRAKALVNQAELDVQRATIQAPFNGRVANLTVSIGDRVRQGDSLLTIYDLDHLEVRAQIPGRYLKQIRDALSQSTQPQAQAKLDDHTLSFKLTRLSGETRQDSGGVDGLFTLNGDQKALTLGTFLALSLSLNVEENVIDVPFNALYGSDRIYRVKDGYLDAVKIERVGEYEHASGQQRLLIRSADITPGDQLVITQLPNAITGLRVEAMNGN